MRERLKPSFLTSLCALLLAACNPPTPMFTEDRATPPVDAVVDTMPPRPDVVTMDTADTGMMPMMNECAPGELLCGRYCVEPQSDVRNCGACGRDCNALPGVASGGARCVAGACVIANTCLPNRGDCDGNATNGCEADLTTPTNCGGCGVACGGDNTMCSMGVGGSSTYACTNGCMGATATRCGAMCVDSRNDVNNCGSCDRACTAPANGEARCITGNCGFACSTGFHACGSRCVANTDVATCGSACSPCVPPPNATSTCDGTACGFACNTGFHRCGDRCVPNTAVETCGGSCTPCAAPLNAEANCNGTACGFECQPGFADCDRDPSNGCEANLTSSSSCGGCGTICTGATPFCVAAAGATATCSSGCPAGAPTLCGATCSDLTTSTDSCGRCGNACPRAVNGTATCTAGVCGVTCDRGYHLCGGACVADNSVDSCGTSCTACPAVANGTATCDGASCGIRCNMGFHECGGACVSDSSVNSCGSSCSPCPTVANGTTTCEGGTCSFTCAEGYHRCGDRCVWNRDPATCGSACTPCPTIRGEVPTCDGTACGVVCAINRFNCRGECVPLVPGMMCDDNNTTLGDGCDVDCHIETGWECSTSRPAVCTAICGDGLIRGPEQCDDAPPAESGDGCSDTCRRERRWLCSGEPSVCVPNPCGNGTLDAGENCDDGNDLGNDGCSSTCVQEPNWTCTGLPSSCAWAATLNADNGGFTATREGAAGSGAWTYVTGASGNWNTLGQSAVASAYLTSPTFAINRTSATLAITFNHRWTFESGFDGGVLEYSLDGGATWNYITAADISGTNYGTGTISVNFSSHIAGRRAFTGTSTGNASGTLQTSTARVRSLVDGQSVRFRFRAAWDSSLSNSGINWLIDQVALTYE